jgi:hypothetical protein
MRTALLTALVLLAATPAGAGFLDCGDTRGTVIRTLDSSVDDMELAYVAIKEPNGRLCLISLSGSADSREFVKKCPLGTECRIKYDRRGREHVRRVK